ncbi:MAG: hypothetical protein ACLT40_00555 [Fusobacterium sp.]
MIKDGIYNLRSIAFAKDFYKFSNKNDFGQDKTTIKIKSAEYHLDRELINILPFNKDSYSSKIRHVDSVEYISIPLKHSIFNFYINKYKINNIYIISNIEEFYLTSKYFIKVWNDKNYGDNEQTIHLNHDSVFYILKHYENDLYNIEKFKISKPNDIFNADLVYQLKQF